MPQRLQTPDPYSPTDCDRAELEQSLEVDIPRPAVARLPGIATQLIGERMRSMYAAMVREPVPDELLEFMRQLESREKSE